MCDPADTTTIDNYYIDPSINNYDIKKWDLIVDNGAHFFRVLSITKSGGLHDQGYMTVEHRFNA